MIIALDIGGTKIAAALVDGTKIIERRIVPSVIHSDLKQLSPTIDFLCRGWIEQAKGMGIACTGLVSDDNVHFLSAGPDKILPLKSVLFEKYQFPVAMLNDAWAAAWGEYCLGSHSEANTLVYITVSTGIGGGIIQNGTLVTSRSGISAHLGHLTVPRDQEADLLCICGRMNCVEAVASGTSIGLRASELMGRPFSCEQAFECAQQEPRLEALIDDSAAAVAQLVANIKAITGTEIVVLGGSVGLARGFRPRVQAFLNRLADIYRVSLVPPALGSDADIWGAALMIQKKLEAS